MNTQMTQSQPVLIYTLPVITLSVILISLSACVEQPVASDPMESQMKWTELGGEDTPEDGDAYADILGSPEIDTLEGTLEDEVISGRQGDDLIFGRSGDDELLGGDGDDELYGGEGHDILSGGDGDDYLFAGAGDDELYGDEGDDTYVVTVESGNLLIFPDGRGEDVLLCEEAEITDIFDEDDDVILELSTGSLITLVGQNLERTVDRVIGCEGGGFAFNFEEVGLSADVDEVEIYMGNARGMDRAIRGTHDDESLTGTERSDRIQGLRGDDAISGQSGDDVINGHRGDDVLRGDEGDDQLNGGDGDDELYGGEGDDVLMGGQGRDDLYGGRGDDTYLYRPAHQEIVIHPHGGGYDILRCEGDLHQVNRGWDGDDRILEMSNGGKIRVVDQRNLSTIDEIFGCY